MALFLDVEMAEVCMPLKLKYAFISILTLFTFDRSLAYEKFSSKEDLLANLQKVGFEQIVEMDAKSLSFKIHSAGQSQTVQVPSPFSATEMVRVPELDIADSSILKMGNDQAAFKIAESFVCYIEAKISRSINHSRQFNYCLFIPVEIEEIVKALNKTRIN
jgi:hypothetical protein